MNPLLAVAIGLAVLLIVEIVTALINAYLPNNIKGQFKGSQGYFTIIMLMGFIFSIIHTGTNSGFLLIALGGMIGRSLGN